MAGDYFSVTDIYNYTIDLQEYVQDSLYDFQDEQMADFEEQRNLDAVLSMGDGSDETESDFEGEASEDD